METSKKHGHHTDDEQGKAIAEVSQERDQIHQQQELGITKTFHYSIPKCL